MDRKKTVTAELYGQEGEHIYSGRCVGLLTDKEFNAIIKKPELQRKLMTVKTIPLIDISKVKDIQGLRLVIIINSNLSESTNEKGIFVTEPIELVSQFTSPDDMTLVGTDGSYIMVKEKEE